MRLLHELNTGGDVEQAKLTVAEYLEQWLRDYADPRVSAKTFAALRDLISGVEVPGAPS